MNDILASIPKEAFRTANTGKFEAKLAFHERCQILALSRSGIQHPVLALAFSVNRRTVTHICNTGSRHYRDVRKEAEKEGHDAFISKYVTEDVAKRVADAVKAMPKEGIPARASTPGTVPSARANKCAGIQVVKPEQCAYSHRLEIAWRNEETGIDEPMGWHYRDLDSKDEDMWLHNGPESLMTSQACLEAAKLNLTDD